MAPLLEALKRNGKAGSSNSVCRYLDAIGLSYAWPQLEREGIVTLQALSQLPLSDFPSLGVTDPGDRRKLFFLVQRVQLVMQSGASSISVDDVREPSVSKAPDHTRSQSSANFVSKIPSPSRHAIKRATSTSSKNDTGTNTKPSELTVFRSFSVDSSDELKADIVLEPPGENKNECEPTGHQIDDESQPEHDDDLDDFHDAVQEEISEPIPPRRSRRLQERDKKDMVAENIMPSSIPIENTDSTTSDFAKLKAATSTNHRISRLSVPTKRSTAATLASVRTQPLASRALPLTEASTRGTSPEHAPIESISSQESNESVGSRTTLRTDSFQGQIEALRKLHNEEYELFASKVPGQNDTNATDGNMRIRVAIRKRPMSTAEVVMAGSVDILHPLDFESYGKMLVYQPRTRVDLTKEIETIPFCFDNVFPEDTNNATIYERAVRPLIPGLFCGQWATLFAYGQTGSGKTYTMLGSVHTTGASACNYGLYFMAAMDIFQQLRQTTDFRVGVSLFEIYGNKLYDLFNERQPVKCLECEKGQIHFKGLSERDLESPHHLMGWIHEGSSLRSTGTTSRNADSSRSHAVLQLHLRRKSDGSEYSRLTVIDLAGSERGADTSTACRTTRKEGAEINTSLLTLKEVIRALANGDSVAHVPFRGSKLTQVLKESFVGSKSRSVMIACVSPNSGNCEQTLNTLRYANRVKERNPDTGETTRDASTLAQSGKLLRPAQEEEEDLDESEGALLDELLGEQQQRRKESRQKSSKENPTRLGQETIKLHKTIVPKLLEYVKEEMELAGNGQLSMEEYYRSLSELHEKELEKFVLLRLSIDNYRNARRLVEEDGKDQGTLFDDDSFEDLRD